MAYHRPSSAILPIVTTCFAAAVFVADAITPPACIVSVLYVVVVLMAGRFSRGPALWLIAAGCAVLTLIAQFLGTGGDPTSLIGSFNSFVSILAIGMSTFLVQRGHAAETALQRAQADLANVRRITALGELTAAIGHEVNQPIAAVVGNASACLRWLALDAPDLERAREAATRIVRDGTRAADIIIRIRQNFTEGSAQRQPVEINQLIRETMDLLSGEAARYQVSVRIDLAAYIPPLMADSVQLQQVIVNLVLNAIDAMKDVEGARELAIQSRMTGDTHVAVAVHDTGNGLASPQIHRLFDPFFTTKPHGIGMGLAISRSIIEAHEGRLWALPNRPRGAIFSFELPVR